MSKYTGGLVLGLWSVSAFCMTIAGIMHIQEGKTFAGSLNLITAFLYLASGLLFLHFYSKGRR